MGLQCKRLEDCHQCPPGTSPQPCWWVITGTGPWRLCKACYQAATGEKP